MPPKKNKSKKGRKKDKGRKGNRSDSSTPQSSSTPTVEDEKQGLFEGGACGFRDGYEQRFNKPEGDGRTTCPELRSPSRCLDASPLRNSGPSPKMDLLTVPDSENAPIPKSPPKSPSKIGSIKYLLSKFSPKKSRSSSADPNSASEDERKRPECSKTTFEVDSENNCPKSKSSKISLKDSKSINVASVNLKDPSSSSSNPSTSESLEKATRSEQSSSSLLTDQSRAKTKRKNFAERRSKRVESTASGTPTEAESSSSSGGASNNQSGCPKPTKSSTGTIPKIREEKSKTCSKTKSKASRGSGTAISKYSSTSNSSETSRCLDSKSFSTLRSPDPKYSHSNKGNRGLGCLSDRVTTDYDPQEGTSSGPVMNEQTSKFEMLDQRFRNLFSDMRREPLPANVVPTLEHMDEDDSEEEGQHKSRRRSKSIKAYRLRLQGYEPVPESFPQPNNWRNHDINVRNIEWPWHDRIKTRSQSPPITKDLDPKRYLNRNPPDQVEQGLLRGAEAARPVSTVRDYRSISPVPVRSCDCPKNQNGTVGVCDIGCHRQVDIRLNRKLKKCRQEFLNCLKARDKDLYSDGKKTDPKRKGPNPKNKKPDSKKN